METTPTTPLGYVLGLLVTLAGLGLSALLTWGAIYLAGKAKDSRLIAFGLELYDLARSVVAHVEVEMRPELKQALADGRISTEEGAKLKARAMELLKASLGVKGLEKLQQLKGLAGPAAEIYLSGLLERALTTQKTLAAPNPPLPSSK